MRSCRRRREGSREGDRGGIDWVGGGLTNNHAIGGFGWGGGIYDASQADHAHITNVDILTNTAAQGGGIYVGASPLDLTGCYVNGNQAPIGAGASYMKGMFTTTACTIKDALNEWSPLR